MEKMKAPVYILAGMFGISFLDGLLTLGLSEDAYVVLGLVGMFATGWLVVLVNKK